MEINYRDAPNPCYQSSPDTKGSSQKVSPGTQGVRRACLRSPPSKKTRPQQHGCLHAPFFPGRFVPVSTTLQKVHQTSRPDSALGPQALVEPEEPLGVEDAPRRGEVRASLRAEAALHAPSRRGASPSRVDRPGPGESLPSDWWVAHWRFGQWWGGKGYHPTVWWIGVMVAHSLQDPKVRIPNRSGVRQLEGS